jgi:hypothetical protein
MKKSSFQDLIARAMTDESFLNEFLQDPVKAAADYNLSEEEIAALNAVDRESLEQIGDELGERISKGYLDLSLVDALTSHSSTHSSVSHSNDEVKPLKELQG